MGSGDDRKLDQEVFERALARAVELDAEPRGELTPGDLLAAAAELGIDEATARAALREVEGVEAIEPPQPVGPPRPFDTPILLETAAQSLRLVNPPLGLQVRTAGPIAFMTLWLSFIAFWTWGAAHAGLFALASIPFWVVGISLLSRILIDTFGRQELTLEREHGVITTQLGPFRVQRPLSIANLSARSVSPDLDSRRGRRVEAHLALTHGTRTFPLLTGRSEAEITWATHTVERWLATRSGATQHPPR